MTTAKLCRRPEDVPSVEHWAILRFGSVFVPEKQSLEWETQGTNVPTTEYWAYTAKTDWETEVAHLARTMRSDYVAMAVKPAKATVSVIVG